MIVCCWLLHFVGQVQEIFTQWLGALLLLGLPFVVFAAAIHFLERGIQKNLAERFGWKSVLWTGWLGTPIHELSHLLMCLVFRHRIEGVAFFEPDPTQRQLGYVRHSWRKGNWFEELGNAFIAVAPLLGGSLVLLLLLQLFYPESIPAILNPHLAAGTDVFSQIHKSVKAVFAHVLRPDNLVTVRFWVFLYLVLSVGSHMAPSWNDYQGTGRSLLLLMAITAAFLLIATVSGFAPDGFLRWVVSFCGPLFALFAITMLLCLIASIAMMLVLSFFPKKFEVR